MCRPRPRRRKAMLVIHLTIPRDGISGPHRWGIQHSEGPGMSRLYPRLRASAALALRLRSHIDMHGKLAAADKLTGRNGPESWVGEG
jgi:hypothetical protein